jgi:hypothetical protein
MAETQPTRAEDSTAVEEVRRARESIAREHNGDLDAHVAQTNRLFEQVREGLGLGRVVQPPPREVKRDGASG